MGVFSHHIDATTALSDELTERGVGHEIIGLPKCLGAALDAQNAMVQFAGGTASWKRVQQRLAVFVTSSVRGKQVPDLARMLLGQLTPPSTLTQRLDALHTSLQRDEPADAAAHAAAAHAELGLPRAENHWKRAARLLRPLVRRSLRRSTDLAEALDNLDNAVAKHRTSLLTGIPSLLHPPRSSSWACIRPRVAKRTPPSSCCAATASLVRNATNPSRPDLACCTSYLPEPATKLLCL